MAGRPLLRLDQARFGGWEKQVRLVKESPPLATGLAVELFVLRMFLISGPSPVRQSPISPRRQQAASRPDPGASAWVAQVRRSVRASLTIRSVPTNGFQAYASSPGNGLPMRRTSGAKVWDRCRLGPTRPRSGAQRLNGGPSALNCC